MPDLLYPYLVSVVSTVIVLLAAIWAFIVSHRRAIHYGRLAERLPLATRWADLQQRVDDLKQEWDSLRDELHQAKLVIEESQTEREWLAQNRAELEQMRVERQELEQVRADLQQALEQTAAARQQSDELQREVSKAEFTRQQMEEQAKNLTERIQEQTEACEREQSRLDGLRQEVAETDTRIRNARGSLADLAEAIAQAQRRVDGLMQEIAELTRKRDELDARNASLREEVGQLESTVSRLEATDTALTESVRHKEDYLDDLRKETRLRDKALTTDDEALSELWQPAIDPTEYEESAPDEEETSALARVSDYLNALGLRFSRRAIYAFHTSLKVAQDAPLLVLAGISGTGKSLLPRRYAEAMGLHFLNVPVQPRWDGPQDLVGFFNHLENRYKATDLVRALIQMDGYGRNWIPNGYVESILEDRLLIVLLDEMNLARVEYYFSEFLSRLEMRRDIQDMDSEVERSRAELPLDVGRFGHASGCRIFVDTNVLFVGTMNEDESTLTLSDKVIDRANVMRFGRPTSLTAGGNGQEAAVTKAASFLHRDTWERWIDSATARTVTIKGDVDEWIKQLNEALTRVGRPFGYRTRNAMLAYVQQYPDHSEDGVRSAVADQVEQRVLPRLRGVDPAEDAGQRAIDKVRAIVRQLNDKPLLTAIEQGTGAEGGHLFTWLGVERPEDE